MKSCKAQNSRHEKDERKELNGCDEPIRRVARSVFVSVSGLKERVQARNAPTGLHHSWVDGTAARSRVEAADS